jgi:hypothetical protein
LRPQTLRATAHSQSFPENVFLPRKDFACPNCGATVLENSLYCTECGHRVADVEENEAYTERERAQSRLEERVYGYIVEHDGDIFLSKACQELGISKEEINGAFERLKRAGKIS